MSERHDVNVSRAVVVASVWLVGEMQVMVQNAEGGR